MVSIMMTDYNERRRSIRRVKKVYASELPKGVSPIKVVDECCVKWRRIASGYLLRVTHNNISKEGYIRLNP